MDKITRRAYDKEHIEDTRWRGKRIGDMTKQELMLAFLELGRMLEDAYERHRHDLDMLSLQRQPMPDDEWMVYLDITEMHPE